MPRDPATLARELLGRSPDTVEPRLVWPDRGVWRVTVGDHAYAVKSDDDRRTVAREVEGQQRAAAVGVPVPEVVAVGDDAFAMRWVDGVALSERPAADAWRAAGAQVRIAHEAGADLATGAPFGAGFGGFDERHPTWRQFFEAFAEDQVRGVERGIGPAPAVAARVRHAVRDAADLLDAPCLGWCHGDLQPEHVLVDPATGAVAAVIDWADHGAGDVGWDVAVLTLDDPRFRRDFLDGYGAGRDLRDRLARTLPLFEVVRLLGEAGWLAEHGLPHDDSLGRAIAWRGGAGTRR